MKKISVILCLLLLNSILFGCSTQVNIGFAEGLESENFVRGAAKLGSELAVSVHEDGVFYISINGLLSYYDYVSEESYILCSAPNCGHTSDACVANAGSDSTGFGVYGSCGYYLCRDAEYPSSMWEFVRVDFTSQTTQILCTLGSDGSEVNQWWCIGIDHVYYNGGYAWMTLSMYYSSAEDNGWGSNGRQLIAIDLVTGSIVEITPPMIESRDFSNVCWDYFDDDHVIYYKLYYRTPYMSLDEYRRQYGDVSETSYAEYLENYFKTEPRFISYIQIDINSMEQTIVRETLYDHIESVAWLETDGPVYWMPEKLDDQLYRTWFRSIDANGNYVDRGSVMGQDLLPWYLGDMIFTPYNGDSMLYIVDQDASTREIWRYYIETGETERLFTSSYEEQFNIHGQTEDKLVGMLDGNTRYAWIYKSDYEQGNFDALHEFSIG